MVWIDRFALPALIAIPLLGALFLLLIPTYETLLRKKVALFVVATAFALHVRNTVILFKRGPLILDLNFIRPSFLSGEFELHFDFISCVMLCFLLVVVFVLLFCRLGYSRQSDLKLASRVLFTLSLSHAIAVCGNLGLNLLLQFALLQMLLVFSLFGTHPHRNRSYLLTSVFFIAVDLSAFWAFVWRQDLSLWFDSDLLSFLILLPALTRLLVPFFSPWARSFFENVSTDMAILFTCTVFIVASGTLARSFFPSPLLANIALFAGLVASVLALFERKPSAFVLRLVSIGSALALFLFTNGTSISRLSILIHLATLSLVCAFALLIERAIATTSMAEQSKSLLFMWFASIFALIGIQLKMLPVGSFAWISTLGLTVLATALQLRSPRIAGETSVRPITTQLSFSALANAWFSFAIVVATLFFFQVFPMAVLPS